MKPAMKLFRGAACLTLLLLLALPAPPVAAAVKAFVTIAPQKYFVQRIGGGLVDVSVLVPPGADPHTFEPKPRQMAALSRSTIYFAIGIDVEKAWLPRITATNRKLLVVRTDDGIAKIPVLSHPGAEGPREAAAGSAGHEEEGHVHGAGSADPHVWLSPELVKIQAGHILRALATVDPANRARYEDGYNRFLGELDALHGELKSLFAGRRGERFMVFHPSWGYFAAAYGLVQVPVEAGGKEPKPAQLLKLVRDARERGIKVIFVQPQFSTKSAELLSREIGGQVVGVDPLAENWAENLREVARKFQSAAR